MVQTNNPITINYFLTALKQRVSDSNAKLLMHSATVRTGMTFAPDHVLKKEEAQNLCMELIRIGGPGFHVGREIYSKVTQ